MHPEEWVMWRVQIELMNRFNGEQRGLNKDYLKVKLNIREVEIILKWRNKILEYFTRIKLKWKPLIRFNKIILKIL